MSLPKALLSALATGHAIPYLGPGMLTLAPQYAVPGTPEALADYLTSRVTVPHKIRKRLTQAAQFIENFKHRQTLVKGMNEAFAAPPACSPLHRALAEQAPPLIVDTWYDDAMAAALTGRPDWGQVQGLSQSEHFGHWTGRYSADGQPAPDSATWPTLLYKPLGGKSPAGNFLVSDTDFVEVLTEIDIQTPIPADVQRIRTGRHFLFLGCRFNDQLPRTFARQIMKRSSDHHWAVLPDPPTRMEQRFLEEQNIVRIDQPLTEFAALLSEALESMTSRTAVAACR